MKQLSAEFIKGVVGEDKIMDSSYPQVAFIGRSNVGKSSTINSLVRQKGLAKTSATPGRTQEINLFLLEGTIILADLPGYGFARVSKADKAWIFKLINWYLFNTKREQKKIVMIIDANIGLTHDDQEILEALEGRGKDVVIVANKIDKLKKNDWPHRIAEIQKTAGPHKIIPYSAEKNIGGEELIREVMD
jgi:GTP-binding protein